jgi:hypothetical protein
MNDHPPKKDPIEAFFSQTSLQPSAELRLLIQQKTLGIIRRRRWLRRGSWLAGLAACYAAGIVTMLILPRTEVNRRLAIAPEQGGAWGQVSNLPANRQVENLPPQAGSQPNAAPSPTDIKHPPSAQPPETALAMEWQALDSTEKRPDLFRLAGDQYLQENDIESATRCYRGALEGASDQDLKISVNDNWLLMSLKQAKQEEKRYAKLSRP